MDQYNISDWKSIYPKLSDNFKSLFLLNSPESFYLGVFLSIFYILSGFLRKFSRFIQTWPAKAHDAETRKLWLGNRRTPPIRKQENMKRLQAVCLFAPQQDKNCTDAYRTESPPPQICTFSLCKKKHFSLGVFLFKRENFM